MSYINNKEPNTSKETVSIFDLIRKKKKKNYKKIRCCN